MSQKTLDYQQLLENALIGIVREALRLTQSYGLVDDHHFYITFKTRFPGIKIPDFLRVKYPDTMTIVLQNAFSNLNVAEDEFGVTLTFDGRPFFVRIPFAALIEFRDPSVEFTLQFHPDDEINDEPKLELPLEDENEKIIQLDTFRKH